MHACTTGPKGRPEQLCFATGAEKTLKNLVIVEILVG